MNWKTTMLTSKHKIHTVISNSSVRKMRLKRSVLPGADQATELLAPLTSAADLPTHPSLSIPYRSNTLTDMTDQACKMVHREKKSLWAVKNLLTKFRGDDAFISCGLLNADIDNVLFNTEHIYTQLSKFRVRLPTNCSSGASHNNQRAVGNVREDGANGMTHIGKAQDFYGQVNAGVFRDVTSQDSSKNDLGSKLDITHLHAKIPATSQTAVLEESRQMDDEPGTAMEGIETNDPVGDREPSRVEGSALSDEHASVSNDALARHLRRDTDHLSSHPAASNTSEAHIEGLESPNDGILPSPESLKNEDDSDLSRTADEIGSARANTSADGHEEGMVNGNAAFEGEEESKPPPHRMTTRAQAQAVSDSSGSSRTRTQSPNSWIPPAIHPLYLMPEAARPDRDFGLPSSEAEETRRLLMAYVQKQEEVVRGVETLYEGLLRADRMRQTVFKWCKAEGHIGEMSDGEDWYDKEEWGLEDNLKKGHDDEEEDTTTQGKKTRKTRQQ